jgi:hypothetical protein
MSTFQTENIMTEQAITQAFEGRWRIKAESHSEAWIKGVKDLCRDFFTAGILIAEQATVPEVSTSGLITYDAEYPDGTPIGKITVMHDPVLDTADQGFETWWKLYDLKVGKEKCMQKWAKMTVKDREACIAATPAYVASTPDKQFRKRPLTYLNQKSWNDEIIPRNNGTDKPTIDQQRTDKLASILTE